MNAIATLATAMIAHREGRRLGAGVASRPGSNLD